MLITESKLRQIVKEEYRKIMKEAWRGGYGRHSKPRMQSDLERIQDELEQQGKNELANELSNLSMQSRGSGGAEKGVNRNPQHANISRELRSWLIQNGENYIHFGGLRYDVANGNFERADI